MGVGQLPSEMDGESRPGCAFGSFFVTEVSPKMLRKTPRWLVDTDDPPLGAKQALHAANNLVTRMEQLAGEWSNDWSRHLRGLVLTPAADEKWYWCVEYEWYPQRGGLAGQAPTLFVIVLMDGTVVQPKKVEGPPPPGT